MAKKIRTICNVEIMGAKKEVTEKALKDYVERISNQKYLDVIRFEYSETTRVENPSPKIKEAFWQSVELECEFDSLKNLLFFTMTFGPSSVEVLSPKSMEIKMHEMQEIAGGISEFMHRYAAQGAGGIVVSNK